MTMNTSVLQKGNDNSLTILEPNELLLEDAILNSIRQINEAGLDAALLKINNATFLIEKDDTYFRAFDRFLNSLGMPSIHS